MQPKATLEDVARKAGVHRTTVSLSLRNHPRIPAPTRDRIRAIATELGYRINPLVSALMQSRRTGKPVKHAALAFVTNYPTRYGWKPEYHDRPDFFPGAVERAQDFGYKLEHFWLAEPGMTPRRFCDMLSARSINGLIVGRLPPGQNALALEWNRFSCVALGMTLRSPILHHVTENHYDTVWQSMERCRERGYRRVGIVFPDGNDSPRVGHRWLGAYFTQQLNFPARDRVPICSEQPTDEEHFRAWFLKHKPDAILVNNARLLLEWLGHLGRSAPRHVGVVSLEHRRNFEGTGMYYDPAKIGALAVEMLIGFMHRNETGVPSVQHEVLLTGEWRDSGMLPARD
ncbi:MAG TPA: LacI family DNA-binding transcriptional regulator [Opitutus sp.]|nr:LacI family DNA-binding transcriptional regulator [Opitutus sp.]